MKYLLAIIGLLSVLVPPNAVALDATAGYDEMVQPLLAKYCLRCHGAEKQEGEFRLDQLPHDFGEESIARRWGQVMLRINSGEMPPRGQPQPDADQRGQVAGWISARIAQGRAERMANRGPVAHYRLSRNEYSNVVYDLLGVHFDATRPGALNEDPRWRGFDRIGSMLSLSPSHVDRYYQAARSILDQAFPPQQFEPAKGRQDSGPHGRWLLLPGLPRGSIKAGRPGRYRIEVQLSALASFKGRVPRISIWSDTLKRSLVGREVVAAEDKPAIVEIEALLSEGVYRLINEAPGKLNDGRSLMHTPQIITSTKNYRISRPTGYKLFDNAGAPIFPLLLVDWLQWEGPLLGEFEQKKRHDLYPTQESDLAGARESLGRFIARAWRRPATQADIDRYIKITQNELAAGESFHSAYLAAMTAVLTSKNFYYIVEGSATHPRQRIDDWELASRLSFMLWSSMPDEPLFVAASKGHLGERGVLRAQLHRMISDAKINRFTESFPQQWLQLHRVGMFPPDSELYPDYDPWLQQSMIQESTRYFGEVFSRNLSIREFLASDWTMLNPRLAMHYGIPLLDQPGFRRVSLQPSDHRGGLLTQAAILSLTSDGTRHRPVHRGVWVSETIFGQTPPRPPPNVEPLQPSRQDQLKTSIRQQLEAHASHATCVSCHRKIDPLGLAFDNYDAIGRWRSEAQVGGGKEDRHVINASGTLPDGRSYDGPTQFKRLLVQDLDRFAEAFVEQLATFALRRVMTLDDAAEIKAIADQSKQDDYRLGNLIENFVMSDLFRRASFAAAYSDQ